MGLNYYIQMSKKQENVDLNDLPIIAINVMVSFVGLQLAIFKKNTSFLV